MKELALVVVLVMAAAALGQESRAVREVAEPGCTEVTLSFPSAGPASGRACVRVHTDGGPSRIECGDFVVMKATVNNNRADGLCDALRRRTLKAFEADAGAEP